MISLLIVDGTGQLSGDLQRQGALIEDFEIIGAKSSAEAIGILEERQIDVLAVDGRSSALDPLAVMTWALRFTPDLKLVFVSDEPAPEPSRVVGRSAGPVFLTADNLVPQLGRIFGQNGSSGHYIAVTAVDVLDVCRIAGIQRSSGAVRLFADSGSGIVSFKKGVLAHASCARTSGSDAFFSMMLWPRGDVERLSEEEAEELETNVWFPSAFLFQEAERFRSVLQGDDNALDTVTADSTDDDESKGQREKIWKDLTKAHPSGVRVIVACSNRCQGSCFRKTLTQMSDSLNAEPPWLSEATDGPSFARVHAGGGGTLALTRVPLTRRHEYLFETLSESAEITIFCGDAKTAKADEIKARSSRTVVSTIGGDELTSSDLWRVLKDLAEKEQAI